MASLMDFPWEAECDGLAQSLRERAIDATPPASATGYPDTLPFGL